MTKLNISFASTCSRFLALVFLFIICISTKDVHGLANYQYDKNNNNDDGEFKNLVIPDNVFVVKDVNTRSDYLSTGPDYDLQYGQIRIIPYKKRTIPIELQKALYAHGIVGRRR